MIRTAAEVYLNQPDYDAFRQSLRSLEITSRELGMPIRLAWILLRLQQRGQDLLPPREWLERCLRSPENPKGEDALFNISNDCDDVAAMMILESLAWQRGEGPAPDLYPLHQVSAFRDVDRNREDARDQWKGKDSGAFLTWMTDEERELFSDPSEGMIPLDVNNVDAVVNANVVHALSRCGLKDLPGYDEALSLVARRAAERHWPEARLYYPQQMAFPYAATRAWREGGARSLEMDSAMGCLMRELLDLQDTHARSHPLRVGSFPGGKDPTEALSTAKGLNALLNLGESVARQIGEEARYHRAVNRSVKRLLASARIDRTGPRSDVFTSRKFPKPIHWESGLFFGASFWDLAHWKSEAVSTSFAIEALAKYATAFDLDEFEETKPAGLVLSFRLETDGSFRLRLSEAR